MKVKFYIILFFIFLPSIVFSQETTSAYYLFDKFENGKVTYKNENTDSGRFNYDVKQEKLLFISDGQIMELADPSSIKSVTINGREFEHIKGGMFYEFIPVSDEGFYIRWKTAFVSKAKAGAYGTTSHNASSRSANVFKNDSEREYALETENDSELKFSFVSYIKSNNKYQQFNSANSLAKLFKGHETEIKQYANEHKIDFKKTEDIKKIITFCNQISK